MAHCFLHSALRRIVPEKMDKWIEQDIHVQQLASSVVDRGNVFPLDI